MDFLSSIFTWLMKKRIYQLEFFMKYPNEVQEEELFRLVSAAKYTEWGRQYDFNSISSHNEFQHRVPIQNYDTLKPYIDRMIAGEDNILWHSPVRWYAKSSGTTSDRSKFIPVSQESLEESHFKGGKDLCALYLNNYPDTKMFSGKALALGGSHQINQMNPESYYGDLSAVLMKNLPFWADFLRTPDLSIALMNDYEQKIERMAAATIDVNVTNISGVPTWTLVLARKVLEMTGKKHLGEVWQNLELYVHGAVSFEPYREQFRQIMPPDLHYLETYNASEGFFAIQDQIESNDMLLMLDYGIFYEFIPLEHIHQEHPKAYTIGEVELNKNYALVISTNGGLWRYMIGDTIRFTSLSPHRIQITGRTKHFINAFGEEIIIDNAEQALKEACKQTGARIADYTACPVFFEGKNVGTHEWLLEFEQDPDSIERFSFILDTTLQQVNSDYEAKRLGNMALSEPLVRVLPRNTFYNWMKRREKLGGQHKVPRLSNDRTYVEDILKGLGL